MIGPFTPGDVAHVIVCATRLADGDQGCATVVLFTIPPSLDLDDGELYGGDSYEKR